MHVCVQDESSVNHNFIDKALPQLVPLLLEQLTKQVWGRNARYCCCCVALALVHALPQSAHPEQLWHALADMRAPVFVSVSRRRVRKPMMRGGT